MSSPYLVVLIAAAWACGTSKSGSSSELDEWVSHLVKGVDTSVTLGDWMAAYPADTVSRSLPTGMRDEPFCRSAAASITAGNRLWRRSAVFVIPPPPPHVEFLPDTTRVVERLCRLRALWLESGEKDSLLAEPVARALRVRLSRALGQSQAKVLLLGVGTGTWRGGESWANGRRVVVTGTHPGDRYMSSARVDQPDTVVAVSFMAGNGLDTSFSGRVEEMESPEVEPEWLVAMARADSAIALSGMSGLVPLRALFAHQRDSTNSDSTGRLRPKATLDSVLVRALSAMRDSSSLPPPQRSAAFLAADIAVQVHAGELDYQGRDTVFRLELERVGAPYKYNQLGAVWLYLRPWLWRAYQLDSLGPAGRSAFAELLGKGWTTAIACGDGPDRTGEVISRGERALTAGSADPMVRLYVAQAYADRFTRSDRGDDLIYDLPTVSPPDGEMARRRAIEHYREGLAAIADPGLRRTIWGDAVRLMLRLPIGVRYYCVYD